MATRIAPILTKKCKAVKWEVSPKKSAVENLKDLLKKINGLADSVKRRELPVKEHIETKNRLKEALTESGQTLAGARLLADALNEKWADKKGEALEKKSEARLVRELWRLAQNEPKLRAKSQIYEEAWPDVEAGYFAKMSLYWMELARR